MTHSAIGENLSEEGKVWEITPEVATVDGGETVGLDAGVGGDKEIGEKIEVRSTFATVAKENLAGEVGGGGFDRVVVDVEPFQIGASGFESRIGHGELGEGRGREDQCPFASGGLEQVSPWFPAGLFAAEQDEDGAIEGGAHENDEAESSPYLSVGGSSTGPRNSFMT